MVTGIMKWMIAKVCIHLALLFIILMFFILQGEKYVDNYTSDPHNLKILHYQGDSLCKYLDLFSCDLGDAPERYDSNSMCSIIAFLVF
jgi:hypothetical protein